MQTEKEEFRRLFEAHPQPMLVYDTASLRILDVNQAALAEYGYSRDEFLARTILDLHPPEDRPGMEEVLEPMRSGSYRGFRKITKAMRNVRKDGSVFEIESAGQPVVLDGREARVIVVQDVSDRRRARVLQERYEALFEKTRDVVLFIATDGRIVDANREALRAYGYTLAELTQLRISDLREPSMVGEVRRQMGRAESEGIFFETVHRRRDGTPFPVEVSSTGVEIAGERLLMSVIRETSERQKAQEELRSSEARFRLLVERSPEGIALCREGRFAYLNPAFAAWLRAEPAAQLIGTRVAERFAPEDRGELSARLAAKPGDADAPEREMTILRSAGRFGVAVAAHAVELEGEAGVLLLVRELGGTLHPPAAPAPREELTAPVAEARESLEEARALWKRGPKAGLSPQEAAARIAAALEAAVDALSRLLEKI